MWNPNNIMKKLLNLPIVLLVFIGLTACASSVADEPPAVEAEPETTDVVEEQVETVVEQSEEPDAAPEVQAEPEPVVEQNQPADGIVEVDFVPRPHRDAPAPVDAIIEDSAEFYGNTGSPQLVEIFTYWCTICASIRPTVHALEAEYWGQVDFIYIDRENPASTELNQLLGVRYQPEFYLVDAEGNLVSSWFGARSEEDMRTALDSLILEVGG